MAASSSPSSTPLHSSSPSSSSSASSSASSLFETTTTEGAGSGSLPPQQLLPPPASLAALLPAGLWPRAAAALRPDTGSIAVRQEAESQAAAPAQNPAPFPSLVTRRPLRGDKAPKPTAPNSLTRP